MATNKHEIEDILTPSAQDHILGLLRQDYTNPPKVKHPWEAHLPAALDNRQSQALDLSNPPPIKGEVLEVVRQWPLQNMLESQKKQTQWVEAWKEHFNAWEQADPEGFARAQDETTKHLKSYCKDLQPGEPSYELAQDARMAAHCQLAAHVLGHVRTDGNTHRVNSAGLRALQNSVPQKGAEFTYLSDLKDFPMGKPQSVSFGNRRVPEALGSSTEVLAHLFQEFHSQSDIYKEKHPEVKWTTNHTIQQLVDQQAPDIGQPTSRLKQKGTDPKLHFDLLLQAREASSANERTVPLAQPEALSQAGLNSQEWQRIGLSPVVSKQDKAWLDQARALPGVDELERGDFDRQVVEPFQFSHTLGKAFDKLVQNETIRSFRDISQDGYSNMAVRAFRQVDPVKFGSLTKQDLPKIRSMGLPAETLDKARDMVAQGCMEQLKAMPTAAKRVQERFLRDRRVGLMRLHANPDVADVFPAQKHPIYGESMVQHPKQAEPGASYKRAEVPLLDAANHPGYFLSEAHYRGLCVEGGKGVLPERVVAMQGMFTTFNPDKVAAAYGHFHPDTVKRAASFASKICSVQEDVGTLLLAYPSRDGAARGRGDERPTGEVDLDAEYAKKGDPMVRIRTNSSNMADLAKYYTPSFKALRKADPNTPVREIPLYLYAPMVSDKAFNFTKQSLIQEALKDAGKSGPEWEEFGKAVLDKAGFNRYRTALDDPSIPVFAIEGEKKSLAVNQMQDHAYGRLLREGFSQATPDPSFIEGIKELPMVAAVGTIGVWLTHSPAGTKEHELRPEIAETLNLEGRQFIIGHDNDGADKLEVAASAATAAKVLNRDFGVKPFYWRPPDGPGKGFDDWVEVMAKESELPWKEAVPKAYQQASREFEGLLKPMRTDLVYKDIQKAQKEEGIQNLQAYITGEERAPQMDLL